MGIAVRIGHCPTVAGKQLISIDNIQQCFPTFLRIVVTENLNFADCMFVKKRPNEGKGKMKYHRSLIEKSEFLVYYSYTFLSINLKK